MKRLMLSVLCVFMAASVSAVIEIANDSLRLQGFLDEAATVEFHEIPAQSASYIAGMPFNIEDMLVQYGNSEFGREIATMDIITNTPIRLTFQGEPLVHELETSTPLNYRILIEYRTSTGSGAINSSRIEYSTDGAPTVVELNPSSGEAIGGVDGLVYFQFTRRASNTIETATATELPAGNYGTYVWVTIEDLETGATV